jgi:hypothetical protein
VDRGDEAGAVDDSEPAGHAARPRRRRLRRAERRVALSIGVVVAILAFVVLRVANPASLSPTANRPSGVVGLALVFALAFTAVVLAADVLRRRRRR